ncbi:MAG: ABC transporter permease [Bacteroidales bacterium]|nr:ABC transporter permease [Bacteroidales bacterium]
MRLPLYIAFRYLFARKSHNVINIISAISAVGMTIGTAALILILSVYNGFDGIIKANLNDVDSDLRIVPAQGKLFVPEGPAFDKLYDDSRIGTISSLLEDDVFVSYYQMQGLARARGVDVIYEEESRMPAHVAKGEWFLHRGDLRYAAVGVELAQKMTIDPRWSKPIELWYPEREGRISPANPASSLRNESVLPSCLVALNAEIDASLLIVPIETMRSLLGCTDEVSAVDLWFAPGLSGREQRRFTRELHRGLGDGFVIQDRYQQHIGLYKMMRYEKAAIFFILLFVVIIIALNIFGSLSMLIIEKQEDIATLRALGAGDALIRRVFVLEGWLISLLGMAVGLALGVGLALAQQHWGLVKMPGNFLVNAYPVVLNGADVAFTALGVALIGLIIAALPSASGKGRPRVPQGSRAAAIE